MYPSHQIGVEPFSVSAGGRGTSETVPSLIAPSVAQAVPSPVHQVWLCTTTVVSGLVQRLGGHGRLPSPMRITSIWEAPMRVTTTWEAALLVILFVVVGALVAIRLADAMATREIDVSRLVAASEESDEEDSSRDRTRSYERIVPPEMPSVFLSDEGQVVRLLVESDGRIRQHRISEMTGWSKSKVSRILSRMYEDGMVEKASIGRENVITLSEVPTADADDSADAEESADADGSADAEESADADGSAEVDGSINNLVS